MELNQKLTKCKVSTWGVFMRAKYLCRNFGVKEEEGICSKVVTFVNLRVHQRCSYAENTKHATEYTNCEIVKSSGFVICWMLRYVCIGMEKCTKS